MYGFNPKKVNVKEIFKSCVDEVRDYNNKELTEVLNDLVDCILEDINICHEDYNVPKSTVAEFLTWSLMNHIYVRDIYRKENL